MTTRPTAELRRRVVERADNCCEYCLLPQDLAASSHQVVHVIAEKHGGQTAVDNLALSCTVWKEHSYGLQGAPGLILMLSGVVIPNAGHMMHLQGGHRVFQHEVASFFKGP